MDDFKAFVLTVAVLLGVLMITSSFEQRRSDYSYSPPTDRQISEIMKSGKSVALFVCADSSACDYIRYPLEELSSELREDLVLYKVNFRAYCYTYPKRCPKQLPALIVYTSNHTKIFYDDVPKAWLREYILGYRKAKSEPTNKTKQYC